MDLNKIDYVIAVADLKNISKAATACFVSQPALTRYIQGLERELGLKLFDHSTGTNDGGWSPVRGKNS